MELNRDEIINALECCGTSDKSCSSCPLAKDYSPCSKTMADNALSLIKELTQANEMLSESYDHLEKTKDELLAERSRLAEKNERLKAQRYMACPDGRIEMIPTVESVRADTVREMQERLKEKLEHYPQRCGNCFKEKVDQIAKEMEESGYE